MKKSKEELAKQYSIQTYEYESMDQMIAFKAGYDAAIENLQDEDASKYLLLHTSLDDDMVHINDAKQALAIQEANFEKKLKIYCLRDKNKICNKCHDCDISVLNPSY